MKKIASRPPRSSGKTTHAGSPGKTINRILVGVRIEPKLVKVMKALSELHDCALGELIERVFWNSMEGGNTFADKSGRVSNEVKQQIQSLKQVYGVNYPLEELTRPRERRSSKD